MSLYKYIGEDNPFFDKGEEYDIVGTGCCRTTIDDKGGEHELSTDFILDYFVSVKPIYTQAMADNGELPGVDELVQMRRDFSDDNDFYNGKLIHDHNGVLWFIDDKYGGNLHSMNEVTFKPITPPIELINGEAYQFLNRKGDILCGIYNKERNILTVEQGMYFDIIAVTHIKPLTLNT